MTINYQLNKGLLLHLIRPSEKELPKKLQCDDQFNFKRTSEDNNESMLNIVFLFPGIMCNENI